MEAVDFVGFMGAWLQLALGARLMGADIGLPQCRQIGRDRHSYCLRF
jgi:hypothetical protein